MLFLFLFVIQIASFSKPVVLSWSISFASSPRPPWFMAATCSAISDLKVSVVDDFQWDLVKVLALIFSASALCFESLCMLHKTLYENSVHRCTAWRLSQIKCSQEGALVYLCATTETQKKKMLFLENGCDSRESRLGITKYLLSRKKGIFFSSNSILLRGYFWI